MTCSVLLRGESFLKFNIFPHESRRIFLDYIIFFIMLRVILTLILFSSNFTFSCVFASSLTLVMTSAFLPMFSVGSHRKFILSSFSPFWSSLILKFSDATSFL